MGGTTTDHITSRSLVNKKKSVWHMSLYFGRGLWKNEAEWTGKRENKNNWPNHKHQLGSFLGWGVGRWHTSHYFGRGLGKNEAEWTHKRGNQNNGQIASMRLFLFYFFSDTSHIILEEDLKTNEAEQTGKREIRMAEFLAAGIARILNCSWLNRGTDTHARL